MDPTDYYDVSTVSEPRLSPDRSTIAFVKKTPRAERDYEATVYTVPIDGGETTQFTGKDGVDSQPRWSPSGDRLAFVSSRGETGRPQLWVLPTDGGEARRITNVPGGITSITWRPDGDAIAFVQESRPEEREQGHDVAMPKDYEEVEPDPRKIDRSEYRQETAHRLTRSATYYEGARAHIYVADLETGTVDRVTDGDADHYGPEWGDSSSLYYLTQIGPDDSVEFDLVTREPDTGEAETVEQIESYGPTMHNPILSATEDGRIAYLTDNPKDTLYSKADIKVYDRVTGETTTPTESLDDETVDGPPPQWGPNEEYLYFLVPEEGSYVVYRAPGDGSEKPEALAVGTDVNGFDVDAETVVITQGEWDHRGDVFAAPLTTGEFTRLTNVNEEFLATQELDEPDEIWFSTDDGPDVQGWVLTPPDFDPNETYPLIVEVHGGPVVMWTTSGTVWHEFHTLANEGYVVFWSNPRGSTGYGEEFTRAYCRDWGGPYYKDLMAGVDEIAARDYVDEDNMFITGGSYGGYMTGWTIGHTDRFKAANPQRGVYDLATFYGTSAVAKLLEQRYGSLPWEEPELFWEHSPAAHVDNVDTPTLIMQAQEDFNTPPSDSHLYHRYLTKCGVEARLISYPRDGHELSRSGEPAHIVDRIERIIRWFNGYSDHHEEPPALERAPEAGLTDAGDVDVK